MDELEIDMALEDDAVCQPRAVERPARLLREVPDDRDRIYPGGQHLKEPEAVPGCLFILRCRNVNRTHGFLLRRRAFVKFLQYILHAPGFRSWGDAFEPNLSPA